MTRTSRFGFALLLVAGFVVGGAVFNASAAAQIPVVSRDPAVQRTIEAQLASVRLDPNARVTLSLAAKPLKEVLDAVARAGGITVRYAAGMTGLDASSTVTLSDKPVDEALRAALAGHTLTFQTMGAKIAFIYPDTPGNREKYTASIRVFPIAKADLNVLMQQLNRNLQPTADGFRPTVLTVADPRTVVVRAVPEHMAWIAKWIAENDKGQSNRQ